MSVAPVRELPQTGATTPRRSNDNARLRGRAYRSAPAEWWMLRERAERHGARDISGVALVHADGDEREAGRAGGTGWTGRTLIAGWSLNALWTLLALCAGRTRGAGVTAGS